jgi:hypothetical protein
LHIVLDERGHENRFILNPRRGTLRELVLSANGQNFPAMGMLDCITSVMEGRGDKGVDLERVTIRDINAVADINDNIHDLPGSSRFKELVFQDATVSFTDSITLSGPSNPKDMHAGWTGFERLCERADVVKIRNEEGERVLGR